jgi:AraC-like DNA-binding protein
MSTIFLYGLSTRYATYEFTGSFDTIGAHFYPHALKSIFGLDANELTDINIDMEVMANRHGFFLAEPLAQSIPVKDKIELLSQYLFFLIRKNSSQDHYGMQYALQQIVALKGNITVKSLQDHLYLSERSIERKFQQYVGMSPRLFTRICRFQASLTQLRKKGYFRLSDIAYENEYSDQSHLIRSFKEFSEISPAEYHQQTEGIITNPAIISENEPLVGDVQFYRVK